MDGNKYLLRWVNALNERQLFFLLWAGLAAIFVMLILRYQRKMSQRNFKEDPRLPRATALKSGNSTSVVKKD